jgi:hypothetical protein
VGSYRTHVEHAVVALLEQEVSREQSEIVKLGLNHEQHGLFAAPSRSDYAVLQRGPIRHLR